MLAMATVACAAALAVPALAFAGENVVAVEDIEGNRTEYASLQEALDAAALLGDPETEWAELASIYLLQNLDLGSDGVVADSQGEVDMYLFLEGYEITSTNPEYTLKVEEGTYLQLMNGVMANHAVGGKSVVTNYGNFTLSEPRFTADPQSCALVAGEGVDCAILNQPHGFAQLEYSVVLGGDYAVLNHGDFWVDDAIVTGEMICADLEADEDSFYASLIIWSGEVNGGIVARDDHDGSDVSISGGRFTEDPSEFIYELGEYHVLYGPINGYYVVSDIQDNYASECAKDEDCQLAFYKDTNPNAWYHDGLEWAMGMSIIEGYVPAGEFIADYVGPLDNVTREQLAVMMYRYAAQRNFDMSMGDLIELPYKDAAKVSSWAKQSVQWAYGIGLMRGYGDGSVFGPQDDLTREQLAIVLHRFAEYACMDTSVGENTNVLSYKDAEKIDDSAMEAMQWAVGAGIITGYTENGKSTGYLGPNDGAQRCQVATMIMRFYYL